MSRSAPRGAWTRDVWRIVASRFNRLVLVLLVSAGLAALTIWGLDRLFGGDDRQVWGAGLDQWVGRLDAPDAYVRDSAIAAVADLVSGRWVGIGRSSREVDSAECRALLVALAALAWRIGDADSLLREHAVSTVLEVTEATGQIPHDTGPLQTDIQSREPLREVVRDVASAVLRGSAQGESRPDASRSALESFAAIGASLETMPLIAEVATLHESPTVRAMAIEVGVRSAVRNRQPAWQHDLVLISLCDTSAEVRALAMEVSVGVDLTCRRALRPGGFAKAGAR